MHQQPHNSSFPAISSYFVYSYILILLKLYGLQNPALLVQNGCKSIDGAWFRGFGVAQVAEIIEVLSQESQVDEEVLFLKLIGVTMFKTDVIMKGR